MGSRLGILRSLGFLRFVVLADSLGDDSGARLGILRSVAFLHFVVSFFFFAIKVLFLSQLGPTLIKHLPSNDPLLQDGTVEVKQAPIDLSVKLHGEVLLVSTGFHV